MTRTELNQFRVRLNAKSADLARELRRREGIAIVRTADTLDEIQLAADRELTTRSLERGSDVLRNVLAALSRMADGTYGTCLGCEEEISHKRLQAVPWATLCIACQEHEDGVEQPRFAYEEKSFRHAA